MMLLILVSGCRAFDGILASNKVNIIENISYMPGSMNKKHRLDLFIPKNEMQSLVVIFIHGGFWKNQDRRYYWCFTGLYRNIGLAIAARGFPVAVISYRIYPEVKIDGEIADASEAIAWIAENNGKYGIDSSRIVLMGHSSGGHLASLISLDASILKKYHSRIKGCVALSPILDLNHMEEKNDKEFNTTTTYLVFGTDKNTLKKYSPLTYLSAYTHVPYLLLTSDKDYGFLIEQAKSACRLSQKDKLIQCRHMSGFDHSDMVLNINTSHDKITAPIIEFITNLRK